MTFVGKVDKQDMEQFVINLGIKDFKNLMAMELKNTIQQKI